MDWLSLRSRLMEIRQQDQNGVLDLDGLLPVMLDLGILMEGAIQQVSEEFLYLLDRSALPRLQQAALRVRNIPEGFDAFGTLLISQCLREVHRERLVVASDVPSWATFRNRFNALSKEDRVRILEVLPPTDLTPAISASGKCLPDESWIQTWRALCEGIPETCFPVAWRKMISEEPQVDATSATALEDIGSAILEVPFIILSRERERRERQPLGTWLFRLASLKELQNPEALNKELVLPDWVIPSSSKAFADDFQSITSRLGGVPEDRQLRKLLEQIQQSPSISDLRELRFSTAQILEMSAGWNGKRIHIEGVGGMTHLRAGRVDEARLAYTRMFNQAESKQDAAMALANLAGLVAGTQKGNREAESLLREALNLNPWSKLAQRGFEILRSLADSNHWRAGNE